MNDNRNQATDGEAKAKPEVIKLGLDLHARQVTECRQLDSSTPKPAQKMGSMEAAGQSGRLGQGRGSRSTAVTKEERVATGIMVSPETDRMRSGQLRGGTTTVREPTQETSKDRPIGYTGAVRELGAA